jgi:hypothetical protein
MQVGNIPVPDQIPSNLLAFEKRTTVDADEWGRAGAIWIRTWYGHEALSRGASVAMGRASGDAEEAYLRLWQTALYPADKHGFDSDMFGPFVFDNNASSYGLLARDADDEVELMGEIPDFILNALMRCPDAMEGCSLVDLGTADAAQLAEEIHELAHQQALLVVIADGEACEDGWVLLVAINHKGQVLHKRTRCKAYNVGLNVAFWASKGEPLDIGSERENIVHYNDGNQSGNGWDIDESL